MIPSEVHEMIYKQPKNVLFSDDQIEILKKWYPKTKFDINFATWKQKRHDEAYILFIIDLAPGRRRKCAMDHSINVVATRELTDSEHFEVLQNIDCWNRVMRTWSYRTIEDLIEDERRNGNIVPDKFINHCKENGWTKWNRVLI